ncbi:MAG TPA: type II toxin-antitoxin system HicB family antitoxin [Chloroflexi bacterium]|nr:type II toxin-antitoxin system HicB family antitoxin [Chloroflexota bacterium]
MSEYPFELHSLSEEDGGGYLITFPDFSECISDGETPEEAIRNGMDALRETIAALESTGFSVPKPGIA